jgi:hypothetical protein
MPSDSEIIDVHARVEALDPEEIEVGVADLFTVPQEILNTTLRRVETRSIHRYSPVEERFPIASDSARYYEEIYPIIKARFPLRAARLRDFHARVTDAHKRFCERQDREEELRHQLNAYSNYVNEQVKLALDKRREGYDATRPTMSVEVQRLETARAEAESAHHAEIAGLEKALAQARLKRAEERHNVLASAEAAADAAEADAIKRWQPRIEQAAAERDQLRLDLALQLQAEASAVNAEAREIETQIRDEVSQREETVHAAYNLVQQERSTREELLGRVRQKLAEAAAAAGLLPHEADSDPRAHRTQQIDSHAVTAEDEADLPQAPQHASKGLYQTLLFLSTVACGSIFGISLAFITGLVKGGFDGVIDQPVPVIALCVLGTFIFWLIGRVVEHTSTLASEVFHTAGNDLNLARAPWVWVSTLVLAVLVMASLAGVEIAVERAGIVDAMIKGSDEYAQGKVNTEPLSTFGAFAIAAVVALPFILFHAYEGWMTVRYRTAVRRREGKVAKARHFHLQHENFQGFITALHARLFAEKHLAALPEPEAHPTVAQARRRVEEARRVRGEHPTLVRAATLDAEIARRLDGDPRIRHAESLLTSAQEALAGDPMLQAARRQLERVKSAPENNLEIVELEHVLAAARDRLARDPQVISADLQVRRAQSALNALDEGFAADKARLEGQRKKLMQSPSKYMRARIQDAHEDWDAAQRLFDYEIRILIRLVEAPRYLLWWEHLRLYLSGDSFAAPRIPARTADKTSSQAGLKSPRAARAAAAAGTAVVGLLIHWLSRG